MIIEKFLVDLLREKKMGKNFDKAQASRPEYEIPDATKANQSLAASEYRYGEIPGFTELLDRNAMASANSITAQQQSGGGVNAAAITAQQQRGNLDLGIQNANYRQQNLGRLMAANQAMAGAQDAQFQLNEFAPWADRYNFDQQMTGLANQRWTTSINSATNLAGQVAGAMVGLPPGAASGNFFGTGG